MAVGVVDCFEVVEVKQEQGKRGVVARDEKAELRADVSRGEYRKTSRISFADHAARWIATYDGRTARGILEAGLTAVSRTRLATLRPPRQDADVGEGFREAAGVSGWEARRLPAHAGSYQLTVTWSVCAVVTP
jgi:hypothetical protein